jgi:hypothetical protein
MKILVLSDSHNNLEPIKRLLAVFAEQVQAVIHLGDHAADLLGFQHEYPDLTMHTVAGNCDYGPFPPRELLLNVNERKLLMLHGHTHSVKMNLNRLAYYAEEKQADVCLFGHTHQPAMFDRGRVFFFNPGSVGAPRGGDKAGYGIIQISDTGIIKGTLIEL